MYMFEILLILMIETVKSNIVENCVGETHTIDFDAWRPSYTINFDD